MMILDNACLEEFRSAGPCEFCRKPCRRRQPHHLRSRGHGAYQIDAPWNLASLGQDFACGCHVANHSGNEPTYLTLLTLVSMRLCRQRGETIYSMDVEECADLFRRLSRKDHTEHVEAQIESLGAGARPMARETWDRVLFLRLRRQKSR